MFDTGGPRQSDKPAFDADAYGVAKKELQVTGFEKLLGHHQFAGHELVLDLACGDGGASIKHLLPLIPLGRMIGVDISEGMISVARAQDAKNAEFFVGDMENLSAVPGLESKRQSVDVVVSNYGMHWVLGRERMRAFLRHVYDYLKPGGAMLSLFAEDRIFPGFFGPMHEVCARERWAPYFDDGKFKHHPLPQIDTFREDLLGAGFKAENLSLRTDWIVFDSKANLVRGVIGWLPQYMERLPESLRHDFAYEVVGHYSLGTPLLPQYPALEPGKIAIRDCSILLKARKPAAEVS